jgi:acetylornithine aminotransferase
MLSTSNHKIAGVWVEPIMGVAGIVPMPDGYFAKLAELTHKYGGLVVSD